MTFVQMLIAIEEMQSQQRAENGVTEIVLGVIGEPAYAETEELTDLIDLGTAFMDSSTFEEMGLADLPDDVRSVVLAERHRKETGAVLPSSFYKQEKGVNSDGK